MISKGNHVKFARFVLLSVMKKQKHDFHACFVDRASHRKIVEDNDDKHRKVDEGGKGAVC